MQMILFYQKFNSISQLYDQELEQSSPDNLMKAIH